MKVPHAMRARHRAASTSAFLLPLCRHCGGGITLELVETDLADERVEVRTFRCDACGSHDVQITERRGRRSGGRFVAS